MIARLTNWLDRIVWGDLLHRYGLPGRFLVGVLRNLWAVLRDIFSGQLTLRAMSLVYTTLLSIVPLVAVSFSVLKGLGVHNDWEGRLRTVLEPLGQQGADLITGQLMTLVEKVNGSVLGSIGLAFFFYTAVSMVQKIEESFNYVWYVSKSRSFARRVTEYLFILLIGPLAIAVMIGTITTLSNKLGIAWLADTALAKLTPFIVVSLVFSALYSFMPNTRVNFRSALVGGLAGGFMWVTVSIFFTTFMANSARSLAVYAGFAIAIFALLWLYLNWLILLIGSQIAFYHQNPAYLRIGRREPRLSNAMRERLALNIMFLIGKEFRNPAEGISLRTLGHALKIPTLTLAPIASSLESAGLLATNEKEFMLPGREMARMKLADILDVVRIDGETGSHRDPRWNDAVEQLGARLDDVVAAAVGDKTLADLLDQDTSG